MVLGGAPSHPQHPVAGCWLSQKSSSWKWPWASSAGCPAQRCATQISAAVRPNPTPCASCHGAEIETLLATCFFLLVICLFFFFFPCVAGRGLPLAKSGPWVAAVGSRSLPRPRPASPPGAAGCGVASSSSPGAQHLIAVPQPQPAANPFPTPVLLWAPLFLDASFFGAGSRFFGCWRVLPYLAGLSGIPPAQDVGAGCGEWMPGVSGPGCCRTGGLRSWAASRWRKPSWAPRRGSARKERRG